MSCYGASAVEIYVDACVLANGGVGVGIVVPKYPTINVAERVPSNLGTDNNIAELYAIIRGMELAAPYNFAYINIFSDSSAAVDVAHTHSHHWPSHYNKLKEIFTSAKARFNSVEFTLMTTGDHHHTTAHQLARKGAMNG